MTEDMVRPPFTCSLNEERQVIDDVLQGIDVDQAKKIAKDKKKLTEYLTKVRYSVKFNGFSFNNNKTLI